MIERIIIMTLVNGGVYGLLASGFSLIFGMAHIINLAHTAFFMLAGFSMYYFMSTYLPNLPFSGLGWGAIPSILVTVVAVTIIGLLVYRFLINRVRQHIVAVLLMTLAIAMAFQEIMLRTFGAHYRTSPALISGVTEIFGVTISNQHLLTLGVVAAVIIILWLLLSRTKLGIAVRATAQDAEVANMMGISVPRTLLIASGIATALAAVAGVLVAPLWIIYPYMWTSPLMIVMVIVVLGGMGNIKGSFIGAFIIALVEALVVFLIPSGSYLQVPFALLVLVIVLVVRPGGLFGIVLEEERL